MGFNVARQYRLMFEGTAMNGAEIVLGNTSIATTQKLRTQIPLGEFADLLAGHLLEWNLEVDGVPIDIDAESILQNVNEVWLRVIAVEWLKAAVGLTAPLETPSTPEELQELPME